MMEGQPASYDCFDHTVWLFNATLVFTFSIVMG